MENQIKTHQIKLDAMIEQFRRNRASVAELGGWISFNRAMITDFQHERLVHLWVTLFFGFLLIMILALAIFLGTLPLLYCLAAIILVVEIFYIKHYFFLENSLQKMYLSQVELEKLLLESEKSS